MGRFSLPRLLYTTTTTTVPSLFHLRHLSVRKFWEVSPYKETLNRMRHIWISGLIDPDKVSPTETEMLYTGQGQIHTSVNKDLSLRKKNFDHNNVLQASITSFDWKQTKISVIDTPARVDDFTVEVENALQAFDCGGVHVLCSVDGLQSQSITVDKKMIRNKLPRLIFINNLDQKGANLWHVIDQARSKLYGSSAVIQLPIGLEDNFKGLVDLVQLKAYYFHGEKVVVEEVPAHMEALVSEKRHQLIVTVAHRDTELASAFCRDRPISADELQEAIRRATISLVFMPIFIGSASKYKGLQLLLDGVLNYLPRPVVTKNYVRNQYNRGEKPTLVALTFTLKRKYGQITYLRIYEGVIRKGDLITDVNTGKTFEVPHLYQRRNDELEVIPEAHAGEMVTLYERCIDDVDYASGSTFTDGFVRYTITSESVSEDSVDRSESALREFEKICRELKFDLFENPSINDIYFPLQGSIEDYINYARSFEKHFKREEVEDPTVEARV